MALARLYERQGQWGKAEQSYLQALRFDPQDADIHLGLAFCYHKEGFPARATEEIRKSLQIMPNLARKPQSQWREEKAAMVNRYIKRQITPADVSKP